MGKQGVKTGEFSNKQSTLLAKMSNDLFWEQIMWFCRFSGGFWKILLFLPWKLEKMNLFWLIFVKGGWKHQLVNDRMMNE